MKNTNAIGVALIIIGILICAGFGLYIMLVYSALALFIKIGIIMAIIGAVIILISVAKERTKEKKINVAR